MSIPNASASRVCITTTETLFPEHTLYQSRVKMTILSVIMTFLPTMAEFS